MPDLNNRFSFSPALVEDAVALPHGNFVEVDDILHRENHLGRKIVQTELVKIGGKEVSVGIEGSDASPRYDLIIASDTPVDLGSFESIIKHDEDVYLALHQVFGGTGSYTPREMVVAIRAAVKEATPLSNTDHLAIIATDARTSVKRSMWIASNHVAAFTKAPLDWRRLGL